MSNNNDLHDKHISKLYRLGGQPEPPEHLDREIKQAAHGEIPTRKHSLAWPSLATAAVMVLSISLVLKVLQQEPMENTVVESSATNGELTTPSVMLQEEEMAVDGLEREEAIQQRYRATKQKTAPARARPQTADAIKLEAAPAMPGELKSQPLEPLECRGIQLPATDLKDEWISLYQKALELGDVKAVNCLQQAYRAKFNQAIPITMEK